MALLDLLGRRWTLRLLWELRDGSLGFRALQARCDGMSPSVLSQRLSELTASGVIEQGEGQEYRLSESGESLLAALAPLNEWAAHWAQDIRAE
jgi:DNA-binding HxlR family transcriptional regulator